MNHTNRAHGSSTTAGANVAEGGPIRVAHRGGNSRPALHRALALGLDWVEADVWLHRDRLLARHDRPVWRLPLSYSRRSLQLHLGPALVLDTLLRATEGTPTRVLIDFKGEHPGLPLAVVEALAARRALDRAAICGQEWGPLEAAQRLEPRIQVIFSLGRPEHVAAYLARRRAGTAPTITSCSHLLLTRQRVALLKEAGSTIIAWTVDSEARARQLLAWGVDGITSNDYGMLGRLAYPTERLGSGA